MDLLFGFMRKRNFYEAKSIYKPYEGKDSRLWEANGSKGDVFGKSKTMRW